MYYHIKRTINNHDFGMELWSVQNKKRRRRPTTAHGRGLTTLIELTHRSNRRTLGETHLSAADENLSPQSTFLILNEL